METWVADYANGMEYCPSLRKGRGSAGRISFAIAIGRWDWMTHFPLSKQLVRACKELEIK